LGEGELEMIKVLVDDFEHVVIFEGKPASYYATSTFKIRCSFDLFEECWNQIKDVKGLVFKTF
jgi:hypothetical protein